MTFLLEGEFEEELFESRLAHALVDGIVDTAEEAWHTGEYGWAKRLHVLLHGGYVARVEADARTHVDQVDLKKRRGKQRGTNRADV